MTVSRALGVLAVLAVLVVYPAILAACSSDEKPRASTGSSSAPSGSPTTVSGSSPAPALAGSRADWTTWGHDASRSGVTADAPSGAGLRSVWTSSSVDGDVYAQPLVVGDEVIVATQNDTVYALDAATGGARWQQHLGAPVAQRQLPCGNVDPVGITSTPVADPSTNRLYVVGMLDQPARHELFALALDTGTVLFHRMVDAVGSDPKVQNQRGALALANGRVYVPFGGRFGDCGAYLGRVVGVAADGSGDPIEYHVRAHREGGFWAPPGPVIASDGTLLLASGNSDGDTEFDDGNAVIRLTADLRLADEFAPNDWARLNAGDGDVGTTSPVLLDASRVFQIGKAGIGYVIDAAHLGGVGGDLHDERICDRANGGVVHAGSVVFIPCSDELRAVQIGDAGFQALWTAGSDPGPAIVAGSLVWVVDVQQGVVDAFDRQDGHAVFRAEVGAVTHFTAPAAGDRLVVVAGGGAVHAFGN